MLFNTFAVRLRDMEKPEIKKSGTRSWSEDEVKLLKRLFWRGRAREIAEQIGRPLTAVRQKAYSMGIKRRNVVGGQPMKSDYSKSFTQMRMHKA